MLERRTPYAEVSLGGTNWEQRNPVLCYEEKLLAKGVLDQDEVDEIKRRCEIEVTDAIEYAESSPWPDPATVEEGVYAP